MADRPDKPAFPFAPKSGVQKRPAPIGGTDPTPPHGSPTIKKDSLHEDTTGDDIPLPPGSGDNNPTTIHEGPVTRQSLTESRDRIPLASPQQPDSGVPLHLRQLGPYIIHKRLAKGGMGAVFLGEDPTLQRKVAIKVMAADTIQDVNAVVRFQREARATATIDHPNVAMIYMVAEAPDGSPFLAMEYIDGGPLDTHIRAREPVPISKAADLMIQVAEALNHAKKKGIIHRDIKPANIMLTKKGQVKVVDFGLAKFLAEDSFRTTAGTVMGTPRYMSPEQSQGREVDFRSDVYALGATFYHYLTGRAPFDGDTPAQIMMKHVTAPLIPMRSVNPDVPMEFDDIVRKCMAKDPNDRYQDYADLISDLSHVKLQWMARERGSLVDSIHAMPTVQIDAAGMPLAPGSGSGTARRPSGILHAQQPIVVHEEQAEPIPLWRYAMIAGAAMLVVGIIAVAMFGPSRDEAPKENSPAASGLQALLDRFMGPANTDPGSLQDKSPPSPQYVRYQYTLSILDDLARGLTSYFAEKGRSPKDLGVLVENGFTTAEYLQMADGTPYDGWETPLQYNSLDNRIRSAGIDMRYQTGDDIVMTADGEILIDDRTRYEALEEQETKRITGQ
ncbi:MAG: eukaryotic-like serine/threonine-protein kinase [Candidatus Sumerlaeota bacterium]|nr:eukaryotic-like serine/threonine-protein kinase [Candidatus Sumerlaeota bacterium]